MSATPWRNVGDALVARYTRSWWRLPLALAVGTVVVLAPLYLLRGPRLVLLALGGGVAAAAAAACFAYPFQTLLLSLFLGFGGLGPILPGPVVSLLLGIAAARALFDVAHGRAWVLGTRSHRAALAILVAAVLTSLLVVHDWRAAAGQLYLIAFGLGATVAIVQLADAPGRVLGVCLAMAAGIATGTLWLVRGLVASSGLGLLQIAAEVRLAGLGTDPNAHAAYATALVAPCLLAVGRVRGRVARAALVLIAILLVATVILTQSRAGVLVLGGVLVFLVLRARRARAFAFVTLAAAAVVAVLLPQSYWVRFVSIAQFRGIVVDYSLQLRQHAMEGAWQTFLQHPGLGVGLGNLPYHAPQFMLGGFMAHNTLLELAASVGVVGLAAWIVWYATGIGMARDAARRWRAADRRSDALVAEAVVVALVAFGAAAMFLSLPFFLMVWVLLALAIASHRAARADTVTA
jgi:O-antigen ligase